MWYVTVLGAMEKSIARFDKVRVLALLALLAGVCLSLWCSKAIDFV